MMFHSKTVGEIQGKRTVLYSRFVDALFFFFLFFNRIFTPVDLPLIRPERQKAADLEQLPRSQGKRGELEKALLGSLQMHLSLAAGGWKPCLPHGSAPGPIIGPNQTLKAVCLQGSKHHIPSAGLMLMSQRPCCCCWLASSVKLGFGLRMVNFSLFRDLIEKIKFPNNSLFPRYSHREGPKLLKIKLNGVVENITSFSDINYKMKSNLTRYY